MLAKWDALSRSGHAPLYPWDAVVSFVRNYQPRPDASTVSVLDLGCGSGANLWFLAREGFAAVGVDGSPHALSVAQARLAQEGLSVPLHRYVLGEALPFPSAAFDLVIDRAVTTCNPPEVLQRTVAELSRVLRSGGHLFSLVYTGKCRGWCCGSYHYSLAELRSLYGTQWAFVSAVESDHRALLSSSKSGQSCSELVVVVVRR